jgi:hypothetical protein
VVVEKETRVGTRPVGRKEDVAGAAELDQQIPFVADPGDER